MGVNESKVPDNGPFCVAIQDTPLSWSKSDVLEAVKEFEPLDATRVQENRWIVSVNTKIQAARACQAGKIALSKEECTIFITACDQDEIAGIWKENQQKISNQNSQSGGSSVTSPDTGQEFAVKTDPLLIQSGVSTVSPSKEIPTGQQYPYQPGTVNTQHGHCYPAMHHQFNPEGMDTRPQSHGPVQQYPYKPNPINMEYDCYNPTIPPPMDPIGINTIPQRNLNPPGQQHPYEPNPMNTDYGHYMPVMPPPMYPLGMNMRPPRTQNIPGQQYPYEPNSMNTGYGRYQPVMQQQPMYPLGMRPPRTRNLPGQQFPCKPNPVNMEVMQPPINPKGMITRPKRPLRNQNRPGKMNSYQPDPLNKESIEHTTAIQPLMDSVGMNTGPQLNANENKETKVVDLDKHFQKHITCPERRNEIKDKFTNVEIAFPEKGKKKKVLTLRGPKNDVDLCAAYLDVLAKELVAGSYRTQVQFFKVLQENIIGINGAAIKRIREETGTCIEFPSERSDSDVIIITGTKENAEAARRKIEAIQEELKVSNYTAEIRAKPEYHKLLRKRGGYNIRNVNENTGVCVMFPHSQAPDRNLISLIGNKDDVVKAMEELESLIHKLDNIVEDEVNVDPKHQRYFVAGKNKVLRQIEDDYDLVYISFPNNVMNGRVVLKGERDCVERAKKRILEIVSDMENEETKVVEIDQHFQKHITCPEWKNEIKDKFTKVEVTFPEKGKKKNVLTLRGPKNDVDLCAAYLDSLAKELVGGSYRTQVQFFKVLQENIIGINGAVIKRIREETGTCIEFPSENSNSDMIIITGMKDNVEAARGKIEAIQEELKVSNYTAEIRAKPEYHKILRKRGGYSIRNVNENTGVCVMFPHSQAADRNLISLIGNKDAVDKAKAELESLIQTLDAQVTIECVIPMQHHRAVIGAKGSNVQEISSLYEVEIKFPKRPVNADTNIPNDVNGGKADEEMSPKTCDVIKITGEPENAEKAKTALLALVPVTVEVTVPFKFHGHIIGHKGGNISKMTEEFNVTFSIPPSKESSDLIRVTGLLADVRRATTALENKVVSLEKSEEDRACVHVTEEVKVPTKFHGYIIGQKGGNVRKMMEEFSVKIVIPTSKESSDLIKVTGVPTNVLRAKVALEEKVALLKKKNNKRPVKQFKSKDESLLKKHPGTSQVMTATTRKLKVSNIPKGITADALQMLFENEKRSGGGDVKDLDFDQDSSAAIIEFEDPSVTDRVLRSLPIEIQGMQLNVEVSEERDESEHGIEEENENNGSPKTTVEIRGISKDTSTDMLELYFENKKRSGGGPVNKIEWIDNVALITFESEADTNTVLLRSHRLNEMDLDVKLYTPPEPVLMYQNKLLIAGLNEKITEDCLTNFLEAKSGVSLTEILYAEDNKQKALVTFESLPDFKKIQDACQKKKLEGAELKVLQVPISRCIIATNFTSKTSKDMVEEYFRNTDRKGGGHVHKVEEMEGAFLIYYEDVNATKSVLVQKHVIDNCQIQLQLFHPCIGKTISVEKHALKQTNWNGKEPQIHNQNMCKKTNLSTLEVCFLSAVNFPERVHKKYSEVKCTIQQEDDIIVYEGNVKYIKEAEKLMHESIQEMKKSDLPQNSRSKLKLMAMKETRDYLKQKFEENGCLGVWEFDKECVIVCDISDQKANEGKQIIEKCLVENIIKITPEEILIINSDTWTIMLADIDKQYKGYTIIDVHIQNATIEITSTDQYAGEIVKIVHDFLHVNALYKQTITVERPKVRYLEQWQRAQIDDICESKENRVKIEVNQGAIKLEGRRKDLGEANNKISALLKQICCKQKTLEKPGIRKYLYSEKGEELIKQIENVNKCTINVTDQEDDTDETHVYNRELEHQKHQQQPVECLNCRVPGGRSIFVFHGDITDFDIHMLISTCNKTLDQTAGLAKAVVEKGGDGILTECLQHKREKKLEGDVFFTNGGNLKCKIIAHGVVPMWHDGNDDKEEYLKEIVLKSLEEADKRKLISIGIPAIGTGIFGFPVSMATKVIVRTVQEHFQVQNSSFVKTIYFCDLNVKHVTSFIEAVKKVFPANDWTCNQDPSQTTGQTSLPSLRESTGGSPHTTLSDSSGYCSFPRIRVIKGELACQQADILVNTTSHGLDLRQGTVSASLLTIGGPQLQVECTNKYPNGIKYGDIAITSPGGLRCKSVFHGCLPAWNNDGSALAVLKTFMNDCLSEAHRMKMTSIIFPALGTGILKYPKDVVAREMFNSASDFLAKNPKTSLVTVEFVIYEKDSQTLMEFEKKQNEVLKFPSAHREQDGNAKSQTKQEPGNLGLGKDVSLPLTHVFHDDRMKVIIEVCAESESAVQNAIDDVEEKCRKELDLDSITDEGIKLLSDDQISEIKKIEQKHNVKVTLQKRLGRMRIEGIVTDVARGKTEVLSLMREIERNIYKEKQAAMLFQLVQWRYLKSTDTSQEWLDFDKNNNAKIEEAYQRKDKVLKLPGGMIIDFEALEQYSEMNPDIKVSVLRKDKIKDLVSEIPSQWDPMDKDNLKLIHLQPTSTEYSGIAGRFMTSVQKGKNNSNIQVLKIERIQNKTLYAQYQSKKKLIVEMNPGQINELDLWHGTAGQAVKSINVHGFNRSFCGKNATMYGDGVYFAKEAYYSAREVYSPPDAEGNKRIYLTKVLTGKYTQGAQGMRVPPLLVSGQPELHDSVVDDVNKPFIFVIFHDTQAYPEYLITFKCS